MPVVRTSKLELQTDGNFFYVTILRPDDDKQYPGLVLIQEWWGIEPHILDLAQKLATTGFVVAVPDLYHGKVATEPDDAERMMMLLTSNVDRATNEIITTLNTVKALPDVATQKIGLIGFCMGGLLVYKATARYADLAAAVAFYGAGYDPTPEEVAQVTAPVLAIYGRQDSSIPLSQIEKIEKVYQQAGKDFTVKIYDAGHAFINPTHGMGNEKAASEAWPVAINFLKEHLQ